MTNNTEQQKKAPLQTLRDGPIFVKIWEQHGKNGSYVTATLGRTYFNDQTQQYGESSSLSASDVLKAQALLQQSYPEMGKWREYLKAQQEQQQGQTAQQQQPVQSQQPAQTQAAPQQPAQQPQNMADQRDQAVANAVPLAPVQTGPSHEPQI